MSAEKSIGTDAKLTKQDRQQLRKNKRFFERQSVDLTAQVEKSFIDGDVAVIACNVSDYSDVISGYSVSGYESANPDLLEYIDNNVRYIPSQYPVEIEICGCHFSEAQQAVIEKAIREEYIFRLGELQENARRTRRNVWAMLVGTIVVALAMALLDSWRDAVFFELIVVILCFFFDAVVSDVFLESRQRRRDHQDAGRLATVVIHFFDTFEDKPLSADEQKTITEEAFEEGAELSALE